MGNCELGPRIDHTIGGGHGLLGFAAIVNQQRLDLHTFDATSGIHGVNRSQCTRLDLVAVLGSRPRHGLGNADFKRFGCADTSGESHGTQCHNEGCYSLGKHHDLKSPVEPAVLPSPDRDAHKVRQAIVISFRHVTASVF